MKNIQNLVFNSLLTKKLKVELTKWNDGSVQNKIIDQDITAPEDQVYTGCPKKNAPIFQPIPTKWGRFFWDTM